MLYLLSLLAAVGLATTPNECLTGEFEVNGRFTGQNIDMNYENSKLDIDGSDTKLKLEFTVPQRYIDQHDGNAFAITFHRKHDSTYDAGQDWQTKVQTTVEAEADTSDAACYSNRYTNKTCSVGKNSDWVFTANTENPTCITDASITVNWADVMADTGALFGEKTIKENGAYTEVFLTATVETWTHFREGDVGATYLGVMTGDQELTNSGGQGSPSTDRTGTYDGDGGDRDFNFGLDRVIIDTERYTLYQIPFILRFPKTVIVEEQFDVVTRIATLSAVSAQDIISLNINPDISNDETFGTLELTFTTEIPYPFGIIGPDKSNNAMTAVVGSTRDGGGTHAAKIEFVEFDAPGSCRALKTGEICTQSFKVRITPDNAVDPCSVAGQYTFEFWAECTSADDDEVQGCAIDEKATDADIGIRRESNAYGQQTVTVAHQDFCPTLMDEIRVAGDFAVYHDETFKTEIVTGTSPGDLVDVFTNDILFFEATYRTSSNEDPIDDFTTEGSGGGDSLIDYVRAQKIFLDVTIGDNRAGQDLAGWNADWEENFKYSLGGFRIPGTSQGMDEAGGLTVTTGQDSGETKAVYNIVLCEVAYITADVIQSGPDKPADCFTAPKDIAVNYLDFNKVTVSKTPDSGTPNTIDENEVAFKLRLDERIIPVSPSLDYSFLVATIQAEVYYKGNRHPTRRLLQAPPLAGTRGQNHVMSTSFGVRRRHELEKCMVDNQQIDGNLQIQLDYADARNIPTVSESSDYAMTMKIQLEKYLDVRDQISIASVSVGNQAIYSKGRGGQRRRLQEQSKTVTIDLHITSGDAKAGRVMNRLQDELMNGRSRIKNAVTAFTQSTVAKMNVKGCREPTRKTPTEERDILRDDKLASSAPALTALFALASAALVAMC